jgi:hypothetical protein
LITSFVIATFFLLLSGQPASAAPPAAPDVPGAPAKCNTAQGGVIQILSAPDAATILDIALRNVTVANASGNGC